MHCNYADITSRIAEPPAWYDEHAVPRYCEFTPDAVANIYADEVALLEIKCQCCDMRFKVAVSSDRLSKNSVTYWLKGTPTWGWGDPPNVGCCPAGPSMQSELVAVLEVWRRVKHKWRRVLSGEYRVAQEAIDGQAN